MGTKRRFSKDFKVSVIHELETKKLSEVCRAHDISPSTVCGWKKDYENNPKDAFSGHGNVWKEDSKLAEKDRLIGQLYAENAFLKKVCEITKTRLAEERKRKEGSTK